MRASPSLRLVRRNRLSPDVLRAAGDLAADDEFFGALIDDATNDVAIALDKPTARLFQRLRVPGTAAAVCGDELPANVDDTLGKLVLDGVLEMAVDDDFKSGIDALGTLFPDLDRFLPTTRLGALSEAAIKSALFLRNADASGIAQYLYRYNTAPASPVRRAGQWRRGVDWLGDEFARSVRDADGTWISNSDTPNRAWQQWRRASPTSPRHDSPTYKIYVSPRIEALEDALRVACPMLRASEAIAFKVGATLPCLLRPDKFVAYFQTYDAALTMARQLAVALSNLPAQGVPLTAQLSDDGLLSWGIDPPAATRVWDEGASWRQLLTRRMAATIKTLIRDPSTARRDWRFVLARLAVDGVDPTTFAPTDAGWAAPGAADHDSS
jgi:hypothetical protein